MPWDIATSIPEEHLLGWQILVAEYERGEEFSFTIDPMTGQFIGFPEKGKPNEPHEPTYQNQ